MLPLLCIATVALFWLFGAGLARLLIPERLWEERWALAPFLGLAVLAVVADLVGFFIPAKLLAWPLVLVASVLAVCARRRKQPPEAGRLSLTWSAPLFVLTAIACLPVLASGGVYASLTNHDGVGYMTLSRWLAEHAYSDYPVLPQNLFERFSALLLRWGLRVGLTNVGIILDTLLGQEVYRTLNVQAAVLAGLVPVAFYLVIRCLLPQARPRIALLAASLVGLAVPPLFLAGEAYYCQLAATCCFPAALAFTWQALHAQDRRSLACAGLLLAGSVCLYPEMLALIALPLATYTAVQTLCYREPLLKRALVLCALAAAAVPFSVARIALTLTAWVQPQKGAWPARDWMALLRMLLGMDPDPGFSGAVVPGRLDIAAALVGGVAMLWLSFAGVRALGRSARLLACCTCATLLFHLVAWRLMVSLDEDAYLVGKLAIATGSLLFIWVTIGVATLGQGTSRRLRGASWVAAAALVASLAPGLVTLVCRMARPHVVIDRELVEIRRELAALPKNAALLLEPGLLPERQITVEHALALFFSGPDQQFYPSYPDPPYFKYVADPDRLFSDAPRGPLYVVQPRADFSFSQGVQLWHGPTMRLIRAEGDPPRAGLLRLSNLGAPELEGGSRRIVRWSDGDALVELKGLSGGSCSRVQVELRTPAGSREAALYIDGVPVSSLLVRNAWQTAVTSAFWVPDGQPARLHLVTPGTPPRIAGESRPLQLALANLQVASHPCAVVGWGEGWYGVEQDGGGMFRWAGTSATLDLELPLGGRCYEVMLEAAAVPGVNGAVLQISAPTTGWRAEVALDADLRLRPLPVLRSREGQLRLRFSFAPGPSRVPPDPRLLGFRLRPPRVVPRTCSPRTPAEVPL